MVLLLFPVFRKLRAFFDDLFILDLLFPKLHVALVQVALRVDVRLILSALRLAHVDVREAELVLQTADLAEPVLVNHHGDALHMPALLPRHLILALSNPLVNQV